MINMMNDAFGGCPECGGNDGMLNIHRDFWCMCDEHLTKWYVGWNVFSNWKHEAEEDWKQNRQRMRSYREVEPLIFNDDRGPIANRDEYASDAEWLDAIRQRHRPCGVWRNDAGLLDELDRRAQLKS